MYIIFSNFMIYYKCQQWWDDDDDDGDDDDDDDDDVDVLFMLWSEIFFSEHSVGPGIVAIFQGLANIWMVERAWVAIFFEPWYSGLVSVLSTCGHTHYNHCKLHGRLTEKAVSFLLLCSGASSEWFKSISNKIGNSYDLTSISKKTW